MAAGRVARLITLGTPHHGTALGAFAPGRNAAQMCRSAGGAESEWLRVLAAGETAGHAGAASPRS